MPARRVERQPALFDEGAPLARSGHEHIDAPVVAGRSAEQDGLAISDDERPRMQRIRRERRQRLRCASRAGTCQRALSRTNTIRSFAPQAAP